MGRHDSGYELLAIDSAEGVDLGNGLDWIPVRRRLGVNAFGVNAFRGAAAGDVVVEDHVESTGQEEIYFVVRGRVRLAVGAEQIDVDAGTAVFVSDPDLRRCGAALEANTVVLAVGGWADRSYHTLPWEPIYLARPAMARGDWTAAAETLNEEGGDHLDSGILRYRLAFCHAQLGEADQATTELQRALEADPSLADRASSDDAFAELRDRSDWPAG